MPIADLHRLSEHFYWLLAETIHVGAYEQAKAGLNAVIKRLVWSYVLWSLFAGQVLTPAAPNQILGPGHVPAAAAHPIGVCRAGAG